MGVVGYFLKKLDFPLAPTILALVLRRKFEEHFRRSLIVSDGDLTVFFTRAISLILLLFFLLVMFYPVILDSSRKEKPERTI